MTAAPQEWGTAAALGLVPAVRDRGKAPSQVLRERAAALRHVAETSQKAARAARDRAAALDVDAGEALAEAVRVERAAQVLELDRVPVASVGEVPLLSEPCS